MAEPSDQDADPTAALRAKAARFGPSYAVLSEALGGRSLDRVVGAMKLLIVAAAVCVLIAAVGSRF